jgi:hypothetical protein
MSITLHGSFTAWALYIGGGLLAMAGIVLLALLFADLRARFEATLDDGDTEGADWSLETPVHSEVK